MRTVQVPLGDRSYLIEVGQKLLRSLGPRCQSLGLGRRCAVISDSSVAPIYAKPALASLAGAGFEPFLVTIPAGETSKSWAQAGRCHTELAGRRLERKSFIVALGGGVVGDLAGFVAATYLRGIPFVQVPTSLLAQVDSSVGGKVGINLKAGKNLVGSFHQPRLVLCDLATLDSLPDRELRAGLAEVIKYGIIYDAELFDRLERDRKRILARHRRVLAEIVARCCEIKAEVVGQDETETGLRAILNFGHTVGHALEAISRYGQYLHGEAISIGQVFAARLSTQLLGFPQGEAGRVEKLFEAMGLPTTVPFSSSQLDRLVEAMRLDKKVADGQIRFVLARKIGQVEHGVKVSAGQVRALLVQSGGRNPTRHLANG